MAVFCCRSARSLRRRRGAAARNIEGRQRDEVRPFEATCQTGRALDYLITRDRALQLCYVLMLQSKSGASSLITLSTSAATSLRQSSISISSVHKQILILPIYMLLLITIAKFRATVHVMLSLDC